MLRLSMFLAFAFVLALVTKVRADEPSPSWLDRINYSGWIEMIHSTAVKAPHDPVTSRVRGRLIAEADFDFLYANVSVDAEKNWEIESQNGVHLFECWGEHVGAGWDMRLGRQTIIWGKADGVQVTDVICPPDYTESITRDLDEIRMPVDAAKVRVLGSDVDLEMIWIPVFEAAKLPGEDNPWASEVSWPAGVNVQVRDTQEPDISLQDSEFAFRASTYQSGFDMSASVFYTWDDYAANHRTVTTVGPVTTVTFEPRHHRMTVLGMDFSRPWSDFVFRFEGAGYIGRYFDTRFLTINPKRKNSVKLLAGVDWTPGDDWSVIAQIYSVHVLDYESCLSANRDDVNTTLHISKDLLNERLTLSGMLYYSLNDQDSFFRAKADYELADGLHLLAGADLFNGRKTGSFGQYGDNSQLWAKVKYSF